VSPNASGHSPFGGHSYLASVPIGVPPPQPPVYNITHMHYNRLTQAKASNQVKKEAVSILLGGALKLMVAVLLGGAGLGIGTGS